MTKKSARGYTLLEMVVAIGIVGIIALVAIPVSTRMRERSHFNGVVREFTAKVQQARALAGGPQTGHPAWPPNSRVRSAGINFVNATMYTVFIDRDMQRNGDEVDVVIVNLNEPKIDNQVTILEPNPLPAELRFNNTGTLTGGTSVDIVFDDVQENIQPKRIRVSVSGLPKILN